MRDAAEKFGRSQVNGMLPRHAPPSSPHHPIDYPMALSQPLTPDAQAVETASRGRKRLHLQIQGLVQGVGFRPFLYRLAVELGLTGWANNTAEGVFVEVEGETPQLLEFHHRIRRDKPPHAQIDRLTLRWDEPIGYTQFEIRTSEERPQHKTALVLPDLATCSDCVRELFDRHNRRYRYLFINCTNCGPRYSIVETLPYDRPLTTMREFPLCPDCQQEYDNPGDRRFHAQPNACPHCGPHLELWRRDGEVLASHEEALQQAETALRNGQIVALKGLGGFQLLVDARNETAVRELRDRKRRPDKPFAVMYPSLEAVRRHCHVSEVEAEILRSPQSPIVILKGRSDDSPEDALADAVSPENPDLGAMLPYTPLHYLLLSDLGFPVVATSGNRSDEPICIDNREAVERLGDIADLFLVHNRPIARPVDDSIVRVMAGTPVILRRARGYACLLYTSRCV
ncbi:[NiFe] hydrogenase metallocenter assembly protein HypF [Geitlerinema sp. FC II]|nr:[NiFe] hydrogenase metallocenter assembly protein HypF [Geitlerinema sp. FC II]